jgi:large repetitive protein
MRIKLLFLFIAFSFISYYSYSQINLVGAITRTGRFANCGNADPTITVTKISGNGSSVVNGVLVITDPCDTTILELSFQNMQWEKNMPETAPDPQVNEDNWIHGFYLPPTGSVTLLPYNPPLANIGYLYANTSTGQCVAPPGGGIVGTAGVYYDATSAQSCCPGHGNNDGIPQNNYGDGSKGCGVNFGFIFRVRLCNDKVTTTSLQLRFRADSDGNTGCWLRADNFFNSILFRFATQAAPTLYNPLPVAGAITKACTPTLKYTSVLTAGCGNSNTVTWWDASVGGNQVGSGSPFNYETATCPNGTTLYAACCPVSAVCSSRKAFLISSSCPPTLSLDNVATTQPTCPSLCGQITGTTISGAASGGISYSLVPANITNTTGVFPCITGASHTLTVTDAAGCTASTGVAFTVPVCGTPNVAPITYCLNATATLLTATPSVVGAPLLWYTAATGGIGSATAPTPITTAVGVSTYYVTQTVAGVESPRVPLVVTVLALPLAPVVTTPVSYCQGATATPLTATGSNLLWYTAATGGVGSATAPTPLTTTVGSTIYYVSQTSGTCESPRAAITVTINATPLAPTVTTPVVYCQGATATALTATGTNLLWYTVATGGTGSATAPTPLTTTVGSTIYYVSSTLGTCEGPRAAITVTVNITPLAPIVVSPNGYCQNITAIPLTAIGTNLLWYANATGGTGNASAPTPITTAVGSTTYYVSQTTGICEGPRIAIVVNITAPPAAPAVATPLTYCQNITAAILSATGTNLLWYANAIGGVGSAIAPTPSTTTVGSTLFYVSQTVAGCEGPRNFITVNVNATPATPVVTSPVAYCQNVLPTALSATGSNILWYSNATGGTGSVTAPTPITTAGGSMIYYVSQTILGCEGPRAAITVNVTLTPTAPTVTSPIGYCQNATATTLGATGTNLLWYATASGGTGSATAPIPSTLAAGSSIYYVSQSTGICEGPRAAITVNVTASPIAPTVISPVVFCQSITATALTATGTNLLWYTSATAGTGSVTAPIPSTTTAGNIIYYVSQTIGGCEGPRAAVTVTVNATPALPIVTTPIAYCQNATATALTATGTNLLWYTTATGGTGSATAPTPSTIAGGTTIFYVSQTINNCEGPRAAITVNVTATPAAPIVTATVTYCQGATTTALTATGSNLLWYTSSTGGTGSMIAPLTSTAIVGSTIYYVSQTINTCEGPRAAITVTVNTTPGAPIVTTPVTYCQGSTATALTATGTNLLWYTSASGGVGSATASTPLTTSVGNTIYYVSSTLGTCEGPRAAITVTVNSTPAAPIATSQVNYCQGATTNTLSATGTNLLWYTTAIGGIGSATAPIPSSAAAGSTIYYVSATNGICEGPRNAITVVVTAIPAAPTVTPIVVYCQGVTAIALTATGTNLLWYTSSTGGIGSTTAPIPSTSASGNTIYYVSQTTANCEGPRAAITVTVNITPAAPIVTTPVTYCQNATTMALAATGTNLLWYTSATGGTGSATAPTPLSTIAGSTTHYVSQTTGICEGPSAAIVVTINPTPALPIVSTPLSYCQGATATTLTAVGSNLLWYTTATGGIGSVTAPTPNTAVGGTTTYYVSQILLGCEGPRAAIVINVTATPLAPAATMLVTYCQNLPATALTSPGTNLLWYTVSSGGIGSATAPTPSTTTAGSTLFYVSQSLNTCDGPRTAITVVVNPTPLAPTTTPRTYCQNATTTSLTAIGTNLLWYTAASGGTGTATAITPSSAAAGATTYYVSQSSLGCEGPRAALVVTIIATPALPIVISPIRYCPNDVPRQLSATGTSLLWYTTATGGVGNTIAPTPITTTPGSTTYYVSQSTGTCEGPREKIIVNINNNNLTVNIGRDTTICEGASVSYTPTVTPAGATYLWRANAVPISTISNVNIKDVTFSPVNNAIYILKATIGGCATEDTVNVNVNWKPILDAGPNKAICLKDSILIKGSLTHFNSNKIDYVWAPTDSLTSSTSIQTWVHPIVSTWYKLTATTTLLDYGCDFKVYDSLKVVVQPVIIAFAGNDTIAVKGVPHQLHGTGGLNYTWTSPSGISITSPLNQNAFVTLNNDANFYLKVTDVIGCAGYDSIFVKVYEGPTYYVPNAFTPNGDGLNDIFRVIPVGISNTVYFRVFNRFGNLVFETNQWLKGWDGTFFGKPQPNGAYVWMVSGTNKYNKKVEMKGTVNLIR